MLRALLMRKAHAKMGLDRISERRGILDFIDTFDHHMLRERRISLGLTQKAVAERANIPLQSYQQFESGRRKIRRASFQVACQVLEALELDITAFLHGDCFVDPETGIQRKITDDEMLLIVARRILQEHKAAFEELAK